MNILLIVLVFGVIVFIHELGHFIFAKINKIAVTEFSIGMGPAIFSITKKGTKYSLRILPIGGYCLMVGEDSESDDENAFGNKPVWARMLVVLAGPFFNFVLAFIFSIILIHFTGCDPAVLTEVPEGGAAALAGVEQGDTILELNGKKIYNYRELLLARQLDDPKADVTLLMKNKENGTYEVVITPVADENGEYKLGVVGGYIPSDGIAMDFKYAAYELRYWVKATVTSLKMIFTGKVTGNDVMGPVGVGGQMNDIIEEVKEESDSTKEAVINVLLNMINWCILLSVNLGIMNLLPIPALDGGRFLFLIVEAVRRRKIPEEKEAVVNLVGFVLLIGIMVLVFFNDIRNVFF
ncbi:MAG: site-2 protease family protein [Clostridium sp.]|nr:site-2 protease family protein [Clostridium sp.]MCM1398199.1 site-2 protease family protein [Clostridium sp.]MCM1460387.1 site-2 protease family protein [Bacteroides sp.]